MTNLDALVIGAGPAGSTAAILLARAGWRVAIAEKASFPRRKVCGEYISAAAWPLLEELGVAEALAARAGPPVTRVGFFSGKDSVCVAMPSVGGRFGRALGREHLDTALLEAARASGATVQERTAIRDFPGADAKIVIAAHGAWEVGPLPMQPAHEPARPRELLGFKAHFRGARLEPGLMPLILFPGGYGGLVESDGGRVSLSCCIRRSALARARARRPGARAGEALLAHITQSNRAVRDVLHGASIEGGWLSAGPIRPAIRRFRHGNTFAVGNAAGEAHPIIAEGISMAIQSSFLLCEALLAGDSEAYEPAWRRNFAWRVRAGALYANALMNPVSGRMARALLTRLPLLLSVGARASGKARGLRRLAVEHP